MLGLNYKTTNQKGGKEMSIYLTKSQLEREFRFATTHIKQANEGLPYPVMITQDWELIFGDHDKYLSMRITYLDGDGKQQIYKIAL